MQDNATARGVSLQAQRLSDNAFIGFLRKLTRKHLGFVSLLVLIAMVVIAAGAPWIAPYQFDEATGLVAHPPTWGHLFGTDHLSRDVLSRVIWGGRISLRVGFVSVALGITAGCAVGMISGYFGGWLDLIVQRIVDIFMAIPVFLMALTVVAAFGAGVTNVTVAIAIAMVPGVARIVRGNTLSTKETPYVEAARAIGAKTGRIILRHVLPNVMATIIVVASIRLGVAIIVEASLSFLGIGVPVNVPTWGNMLSGAGLTYMVRAPWMGLFPGLMLTLAVLAMNLLGDALRDLFDPRLRGSERMRSV